MALNDNFSANTAQSSSGASSGAQRSTNVVNREEQSALGLGKTTGPEDSSVDNVAVTKPKKNPTGFLSWWTLKNKATLLAVALGTLPVLVVGGVSTAIAGKQLSQDAIEQQQQFTNAIALNVQDAGTRPTSDDTVLEESLSEETLKATELRALSRRVNQRIATLQQGMESQGSLQFSVIDERSNQILISNSQANINTEIESLFPEYANLSDRNNVATFKSVSTRDNQLYLLTYAPVRNTPGSGAELGVLVYQPMSDVFATQQSLVFALLSGTVLTALLVSMLAAYLANRATQPIIAASRAVAKLGQGKFDTRLPIRGQDELAVLNSNINVMAEQLEYQLEFIEDTAQRQGLFQAQAAIAQQQVQAKASMQRELSQLLQSVEGIAQGDLTVQAEPTGGEIGPVGDLFNTLLAQLREIVTTARQTSQQVTSAIESNQTDIKRLADTALAQTAETPRVAAQIEDLLTTINTVANSTQQAEQATHNVVNLAQQSEQTMAISAEDATARQATIAETTNRIRLLSSASQQISQVVSLINEVALKTNLVAINASIGTKQTSDAGEGSVTVTSEIGQLTDQATRATREIERIVQGIQSEAKEIAKAMELDTAQATAEATRLNTARAQLLQAIEASNEIDKRIKNIADSAHIQQTKVQTVNEFVQQIRATSQQTSEVTKQTEGALRSTANMAQQLANIVKDFKLD